MVNWDPKFQSAISDLEVEQIEVRGKIWELKYFLEEGTFNFGIETDENGVVLKRMPMDHVVIATTDQRHFLEILLSVLIQMMRDLDIYTGRRLLCH